MMFSREELLLMIGVVSVLLLCISILTILDIRDYLKAKKGMIVDEDLEPVYEEEKSEPILVTEVEETIPVVKEDKEEEVYFEEMEDENFEVKKEVAPVVEVIPKVEVNETKAEIETPKVEVKVPKIEVKEEKKKLDAFLEYEEIENNLPNKKDDVTNFEAEQERTAIISLDELMQKSNELYSDNEAVQYDDGNEPITIDEVIKMFRKDEVVAPIEETKSVPETYKAVVEEEKIPYSKKETIPFVSSIYGIEKDDNALEFENTATYEKLDREKYNDFVAQLKEMNENK